ncbi:hypothetical protein OsI_35958 [Oryza sativa Indica Group]|uniref:DUF834 domain-containing protein n=2 Tax=Oryza TaxID=4527 RepID=A0A0E0J1D8_ORYNI|nr:hypothetical protein OsI_35958 [Oryza sativa Indica Group]
MAAAMRRMRLTPAAVHGEEAHAQTQEMAVVAWSGRTSGVQITRETSETKAAAALADAEDDGGRFERRLTRKTETAEADDGGRATDAEDGGGPAGRQQWLIRATADDGGRAADAEDGCGRFRRRLTRKAEAAEADDGGCATDAEAGGRVADAEDGGGRSGRR